MKPTAAELNLRIEEVKQALLSGMPRYAIVENVKKKYGVSISTGDNYIAKARKALDNDLKKARPYMLAEHIAHRRDLRTRFRKANDLHGELKAAQDEAKILGLYPAIRTELTGLAGKAVAIRDETNDLSDEEIDRRIAFMAHAALAAGVEVGRVGDVEGAVEDADSAGEG